MPPILVKYRRLISLALADNAILFTTATLVGHRVQIQMSVDDLNTFFIWQRPSGAIRPVGHFLSEVNGVNFSDIILDSLTKVFVDLDGTSDGLNFSSYIFDANLDSRIRTGGRVSANDLVLAYILYKCYGSSACPTANVIYNLEDAISMLSSDSVSMIITNSFEEDEALAAAGGSDLGGVDNMFRNMLSAAPRRYFQANGTQIPGLFETNWNPPPSDPSSQGSWMFMENDVLELRVSFTFKQPVAHQTVDELGSQTTKTVINAGDNFSILLQILATDTPSGAQTKAAALAAAKAAAIIQENQLKQRAATNATLAAVQAQQAVNSAAAQQQTEDAELNRILTSNAEQQIAVNNALTLYNTAEASLQLAVNSGASYEVIETSRAAAAVAAANLAQNQAIYNNLSTQLTLHQLKHDAAVSTLEGKQFIAANAILKSATANSITSAAALAAAQSAAATMASNISTQSSPSTIQFQTLLSNAVNPSILLQNQLTFTNASNAVKSARSNALVSQANLQEATSLLTNAENVLNMAIVLGNTSGLQIMMANVNAYSIQKDLCKKIFLSTNQSLIYASAKEYTALTTLLANSNLAANLSNLLEIETYNSASLNLSSIINNIPNLVQSDANIQSQVNIVHSNLTSSLNQGGSGNEINSLTSSLIGLNILATSSSAAVTNILASSNTSQTFINSALSNINLTTANISTISSVNSGILSTFSTNFTNTMYFNTNIPTNPSTLQTANSINQAHLTYNTMLEKASMASNALVVARRILETGLANRDTPEKIALFQSSVTNAQDAFDKANAALNRALSLYNSASSQAIEDPQSMLILNTAASSMILSISTALNNQLANHLYATLSSQNAITSVLNETSIQYTLAMNSLNNAITSGKPISEIQRLNLSLDIARKEYTTANTESSAAAAAVSTAQAGVTADPTVLDILQSAALISYSTTQGVLANELVEEVTELYEESYVSLQSTLVAQLNYSTSVHSLMNAVIGGSDIRGIQGLQSAVNSSANLYALTSRASIQLTSTLIREQEIASVNPLALTIMNRTFLNSSASAITNAVDLYAVALVKSQTENASTLVAMQTAQNMYDTAVSVLDLAIGSGKSITDIQQAQTNLQNSGASLASATMNYNYSLSTLNQARFYFSTSTAAYTSTIEEANVEPLPNAVERVIAQVAVIASAVSTQSAALASKEVVNLASIVYEAQLQYLSSMASLSTISSLTFSSGSTLTSFSQTSTNISSYLSTFQTYSNNLALVTGKTAGSFTAYSTTQASLLNYEISPFVFTAIANYTEPVSSLQPPPSEPILLQFTSVKFSEFTVSWQGGIAATSYTYSLNGMLTTPANDSGVRSLSARFTDLSENTLYTLIITANNSKGSISSKQFTVTTRGVPPFLLNMTSSNITSSSFKISWTGGDGVTGYSYSMNGSPVIPHEDKGLLSNYAVFNGLLPNSSYVIFVSATNTNGTITSQPLVIRTLISLPTKPSNPTASPITHFGFTVGWTGGVGATSYSYKLNENSVTPSVDNGLTSQTARFQELLPSTTYILLITATNSTGSVTSDPYTIITQADTSPPTQPILSSTSLQTTITLNWTGGIGATSYSYKLNGNPVTPSTDNGLNKSAIFSELTPSTSYSLLVTAINLNGSTISQPLTVTTLATPPTPPVGSFTDVTSSGFKLSWTGGDNGTEYSYVLNSIAASPSLNMALTGKYAVFTGLQPGTIYRVELVVSNTGGFRILPFLTLETLPSSVEISESSSITPYGFTVNWTGGNGASSYQYTLNGVSALPSTDNGISNKSAVFTELIPLTSYSLVVIAYNSRGGTVSSTPFIIETLAGPPTPFRNIVFSSITTTGFAVSWSGGDAADSYSFTIDSEPAIPSITPAPGLSSKSAVFDGLNPQITYYFIITATNNEGTTSIDEMEVETLPLPPSQIQQVESLYTMKNGFSLTWVGGQGASSYSYILQDSSGIVIDPTTYSVYNFGDSVAFSGLSVATEYSVIITATNSNTSVSSIPYSITTASPTSLDITNFTTSKIFGGVKISWSGATGAVSYSYIANGNSFDTYVDRGLVDKTFLIFGCSPSSDMYIVITATDSLGNSSTSAITVRAAPGDVCIFNPVSSSITQSSFTVSWTIGDALVATSYSYLINGSLATPSIDNGLTSNSATFTGLSPNTSYTILIIAQTELYGPVDSSLTELYGPIDFGYIPFIVTTLMEPPTALIDISSNSITSTGFSLTWSGGQGAESYSYQLDGSPVTPSLDSGVSSKSASFTGLNIDTSYTVVITAINNGGSTSSSPFQVTIPPLSALIPSEIILDNFNAVTNISSQGFTIEWTGGDRATSYSYNVTDPSGNTYLPSINNGVSNKTATFANLPSLTSFTIYITAINTYGRITSVQYMTTTSPDLTPNMIVSTLIESGYSLTWSDGQGAVNYSYEVRTNGDIVTPIITDNGVLSKTAYFRDLNPLQTTVTIITATDASGNTATSLPITVTTGPAPASNFSISSVATNEFTVSWTGGDVVSSYIYRLNGVPTTPSVDNGIVSKSATFSGLVAGKTYSIMVTTVYNNVSTPSTYTPSIPIGISENFVALPYGLSIDLSNNLFLSTYGPPCTLIRVSNDGITSVLSGTTNQARSSYGVCYNAARNILVQPDYGNHRIFLYSITADAATIIGGGGDGTTPGNLDGIGQSALVMNPSAAVADALGNTYILDAGNNNIRMLDSSNALTTFATGFQAPMGITIDSLGNLYVSDTGNHCIKKVAPDGTVTLYAGIVGVSGFSNSSVATNARFNNPSGLTCDASDNIVVADTGNNQIRIIKTTGEVFTYAGTGEAGFSSGYLLQSKFNGPWDIKIDSTGTILYITDTNNNSLRRLPYSLTPLGEIYITTTSLSPELMPQNITITSITASSFGVTWTVANGAESYSYLLNGTAATPSTDDGLSNNSVTFSQLNADTLYTVVIIATFNEGSSYSPPFSLRTTKVPPTEIIIFSADVTQTEINLSWSGGDGVESYSYTLNGVQEYPYIDDGLFSKYIAFYGLVDNTSYTIVITAINNGGSTSSSSYTVSTLMNPPTVISNIQSSSITQSGFSLSWTGGQRATSYSYELDGSPVTPSLDSGVSNKSATFTELSSNTSYEVLVTAINNGGQTSSPITVKTLLGPPTAITDVSSNSITQTEFSITWSGAQDAESYSYELNGTAVTPSIDNGLSSKSATFTGLTLNTSYTVLINAINNGGSTSASYTLTTLMEAPTSLTNVSINSMTTTGFSLTWSGGEGATSYSYEVNGSLITPSLDSGVSNKSATFTELTPNTSCTVVITAINNGGSTSASYTITLYTNPPTEFTNITMVNKTSNLFKVSWSGAQNTSLYSYTIDGTTVTPFNDNGIANKSAVFAGLTPNTSYVLVITSINPIASLTSSPFTVTLNPLITYDTKYITHLVNNNINNSSTELSWNGGEETTQYTVIDPNSGLSVPYTLAFNTTNKTATVSNINGSSDYSVILEGINQGNYALYLALTPGNDAVLYSSDGFEWKNLSNINSIIGQDYLNTFTLKYANGLWQIGSLGNSYVILYSYDGFNWNLSTSAKTLLDYCFVIEKNDISGSPWLAGGMGANCRLAYSYDGITWLPSTSANNIFTYQCRSLKWNGSMWLAGGYGAYTLAYSYDGINWVSTTMPSINPLVSSIEWLDGVWMYVNIFENSKVYYTTNASDPPEEWIWNSSFLPGDLGLQCEMLTYNGNMCFAVGTSYYNKTMFYSLDKGITWIMNESGNSIFTGSCSSIKWNGTMWIAGGHKRPNFNENILSGHIAYSYDGINWIQTFFKGGEIYITDIEIGFGSYKSEKLISFTTNLLNSDPNTFTASAISNSGFTISWSGGTSTNVYTYALDNIPITPTIDNGLSQQTATFSGLTPSTLYTVSITYNTENERSMTSSVLVKTLPA